MHLPRKPATVFRRPNMAWSGSEFEESMANIRTQTTSRNLLLQAYICAAELATWGVGPDVIILHLIMLHLTCFNNNITSNNITSFTSILFNKSTLD